jgi:hypothetical protein
MRILLGPAENRLPLLHIYNVLTQIDGVEVLQWRKDKSFYFMLSTLKPDMVFADTNNITINMVKLSLEFNIPIIGFGEENHIFNSINTTIFTFIDTNSDNYIRPGANIASPAKISVKEVDVLVVGLYNTEVMDVLYQSGLRFKLVGNTDLGIPEYVGATTPSNIIPLYNASQIILSDDNLYDIAINQCFAISSYENELFPHYKNSGELEELLGKYINNPKLRNKHIKEAYNIAKNNTFFHRLSEIFLKLNHKDLADKCLKKLEQILA